MELHIADIITLLILKEFYPTKVGLLTTDWTGWQFNGYYEKGNDKATFYDWTRDQVNATANVEGSEPYPCSKNFYLVYKGAPQTHDITLTYDANGGSGAPESETQKVEIGKEATFKVSSQKPTRNNYDFEGWSTERNAKTVRYHGGDSITISENTTLYAVWANPAPSESPAPSEKPEPTATPTPNIPWVPGHGHNHNNNGVPPIVYMPPKTGDMPFWYSIAQFLGLVK